MKNLVSDNNLIISNKKTKKMLFALFFWAILGVVWGLSTVSRQSIMIDGIRHWFLADDVMISMRYARNFADGLGLVWNPGERVEGYTNFLWVLIMSLVHYLGVPERTASFFLIALNIFFQFGILITLYKLICELTQKYIVAFIIAATFLIADISSMVWGTSGFEVTLIALIVTYCTYRIIHELKFGEIHFLTFLLLGSIPLVRADGVVIAAIFLGLILIFTGINKRNFIGALVALIPFFIHLLFRIIYYGELAPNTATLKLFDLRDRILYGIDYGLIFFQWYWPLLILIIIIIYRDLLNRRYTRSIIFLGCLGYIAYVVYVGGDGIGNNRFFVPIIPLIFALSATALSDIFSNKISVVIVILVLLLARFSLLQVNYKKDGTHIIRYSQYLNSWTPSHDGVLVGTYLNKIKSDEDVLAVFPAGQAPYFSMIYSIDMLGKADKHISKKEDVYNNRPGHNKFDIEYSMSRKPTYVYPGWYAPWPELESEQNQLIHSLENGGHQWLYALFTNPEFIEYCLPYPVETGAKQAIFECVWN